MAGGAAAGLMPLRAVAQDAGPLKGTVRGGNIDPIPVAITDFTGDDPKVAFDVTQIVANDLQNSGLFKVLPREAFLEQVRDINQAPRFADWKAIEARAVVVGRISRLGDGRLKADFRAWDVLLAKSIAGASYTIPAATWRRAGHIIADQVYSKFTGEGPYFDSRIVFIDESGPKERRVKRLAIMDQDGANVRLLSQGKELVLTPRFSPVAQEICFMQYSGENPRVFLMNLETGQRELVGNIPGMSFSPRFSPDGQRIVMSIQEQGSGATFLVEMDLRSKQMRRLTPSNRIDTGPCYSPDGRRIVFESDRDGGQALYVMGADGGGAQRISGADGRFSTPVWSPRGDFVAFTKQTGGRFLIGVMKPDGSGERILSDGFHNEGPTWSPNGRVLMFFREGPGAGGGPRLVSVDVTGYNERQVTTPSFGSDPAWSPLLA